MPKVLYVRITSVVIKIKLNLKRCINISESMKTIVLFKILVRTSNFTFNEKFKKGLLYLLSLVKYFFKIFTFKKNLKI